MQIGKNDELGCETHFLHKCPGKAPRRLETPGKASGDFLHKSCLNRWALGRFMKKKYFQNFENFLKIFFGESCLGDSQSSGT
jgi:hypothetical protein